MMRTLYIVKYYNNTICTYNRSLAISLSKKSGNDITVKRMSEEKIKKLIDKNI